jgi:hypothetical protein
MTLVFSFWEQPFDHKLTPRKIAPKEKTEARLLEQVRG